MGKRWMGLLVALLPVCVSQCYLAKAYTYSINTSRGTFTVIYHDLRSDGDSDSARAADWLTLKEAAASRETGLDTQVFVFDTAMLFAEGNVLSGRQEYHARCPRCFPSGAAYLETILSDHSGFRFQRMRDDVMLTADTGITVSRSNGQIVRTASGTYVFWDVDDTAYSITWSQSESDTGVSLFPYYQKEQKKGKTGKK